MAGGTGCRVPDLEGWPLFEDLISGAVRGYMEEALLPNPSLTYFKSLETHPGFRDRHIEIEKKKKKDRERREKKNYLNHCPTVTRASLRLQPTDFESWPHPHRHVFLDPKS